MIVTKHGKHGEFFKGIFKHNGKRLVFFGWTRGHVMRKQQEWLEKNAPVGAPRNVQRPALRLVANN